MASQNGGRGSHPYVASGDAIVSRLAQQDRIPWYKKPNLRLMYIFMLPACLGVQMTSGFDASMLNGLQAVPSWVEYYHHPRSSLLGIISAMHSLGALAAAPFVPSVVDKFGRRYSILAGSILTLFGAALQGSALNLAMFNIARFILGLGVGFTLVAATSLTGELSHPKERPIMSSLLSVGHMAGSIAAAGVTLGTFSIPNNWGWRIPSYLQAVPCLLQVFFIWFIPESPRWLISKGRKSEAYALLVKYHGEGDEHSEFVKAEYNQIEQTLAEELKNVRTSWKEVLSTTGMRRRVIIASFLALFMKWSGNGLLSYFLSPVLDNVGIRDNRTKNTVNFVRAGWNLVNCTFFALIVPQYSRRKVYLASAISVLVVLIAWTAASAEYARTHSVVSSQVVLALVFLFSPVYNFGFSALMFTYLVELFPFRVRARGITIFQWWSRIAMFVSQLLDPIGIDAAGWRYYLIHCAWMTFAVVFIYLVFPETSGRTLEELTFLFEGDREHCPRTAEVEPLLHGHRLEASTYNSTEDDPRVTSRVGLR